MENQNRINNGAQAAQRLIQDLSRRKEDEKHGLSSESCRGQAQSSLGSFARN